MILLLTSRMILGCSFFVPGVREQDVIARDRQGLLQVLFRHRVSPECSGVGAMELRFNECKNIDAMVLQEGLDVFNLGCWMVLFIQQSHSTVPGRQCAPIFTIPVTIFYVSSFIWCLASSPSPVGFGVEFKG